MVYRPDQSPRTARVPATSLPPVQDIAQDEMVTTQSERIETLRSYDVSESAARAYLALLELGTTEAREVARISGTPTSKVYHILDYLQAKGLCRILPESPKRYAPIPFGEFLDARKRHFARAIEAIDRERGVLEARYRLVTGTTLDDRGRFHVLAGRANILDKETALLAGAKREVMMFCTPGRILRMRRLLGELEAAQARGVRLRMLIPYTPAWPEDRRDFSRLGTVRVRDHPEDTRSQSVAYLMTDRENVLVVDYVPDDESLQAGHDAAIHVQQQGTVSAMQDLMEAIWAQAPRRPRRASVLRRARRTR
jgi:sugar-specific transcriptional regulator TrmB